ncbi:hypothetical protein [Sphingopyxis sp. JAI108]|uniref:hypothetical protein n=1 Tax=Sphingopyxis sp. JAI108 TaxID=2723060 RepID=UPI0015C8633D|nr:hypothetical protein [Sphingopyxis sp. JAI108]NYF33580.1 hypothetical protein [Sphingopyxis sp. JAI108]
MMYLHLEGIGPAPAFVVTQFAPKAQSVTSGQFGLGSSAPFHPGSRGYGVWERDL